MVQESLSVSNVLIRADHLADEAWSRAISSAMPNSLEGQRLIGTLRHPIWRPLLELYFNDSVTMAGAQTLRLSKLAEIREITARVPRYRGEVFPVIVLSAEGLKLAEKINEENCESEWFNSLILGVTDYACRDAGQGVCLGSEHLTTAMENGDREILARVVSPDDQMFQFDELEDLPFLSEQVRLDTSQFWSPRYDRRTSAKFIFRTVEYGQMTWSPDAFEMVDEIASRILDVRDHLSIVGEDD
jgi:hypothetical protein